MFIVDFGTDIGVGIRHQKEEAAAHEGAALRPRQQCGVRMQDLASSSSSSGGSAAPSTAACRCIKVDDEQTMATSGGGTRQLEATLKDPPPAEAASSHGNAQNGIEVECTEPPHLSRCAFANTSLQ